MTWWLFVDKTQFLLIPAIGFTTNGRVLCLTFAWMHYGFSLQLGRTGSGKD